MEKCEGIEKIPLTVLILIPLACAVLNGCFLLLLRGHRLQMSDSASGAVCGFLIGIEFVCGLVGMMRMRLAQ
jgi:hypothetical protein